MSREGQSSVHNLFKKRLKSSYAIGANSTQIVQNLRVTNKCLSLRLGIMREDLQQVQKHNVELIKENQQLKHELQELQQNPLLEKFPEVKERIDNLKNKMYILSSVASGAAETIVDLSQICSWGTLQGNGSNMTTLCSVPDTSGDAACSLSADSEITGTKAFPGTIKHRRSHRQTHPLQTHYKQKLCPTSSEDESAACPKCTESWSFGEVVASLSPTSACNCAIKLGNYTEKREEPETYATRAIVQHETQKNIDLAQKNHALDAWVAASRFHTNRTTSDNELTFFKSPNSCYDERLQKTVERVSQNSPKVTEARKSPITLSQQNKVGLQQENRPKSKSPVSRKDESLVTIPYTGNVSPKSKSPASRKEQSLVTIPYTGNVSPKSKLPVSRKDQSLVTIPYTGNVSPKSKSPASRKDDSSVTIPYTGNVRSNKATKKQVASAITKRPGSSDKIKLKKCDGLNNTANERVNVTFWGVASPAACRFDKNNIDSDFPIVDEQENAAKSSLFTRMLKSHKLKKSTNKVCKNSPGAFAKTKYKSRKQKLAEQFPVFLNAEKQRLSYVLSMPADKTTFPLPSFKNTNETLSMNNETVTVDRLSNINLCDVSNKQVQLEEKVEHVKALKVIAPSIGDDFQNKRHGHDSKLNAQCEYRKDIFDEGNSMPSLLICPSCMKIDHQQRTDNEFHKRCLGRSDDEVKQNKLPAEMPSSLICPSCMKTDHQQRTDNEFQKRCLGRSDDEAKQNKLTVEMPIDCSTEWFTKTSCVSYSDLCNEFKNADTNTGGSDNQQRNSVRCSLPNQQNMCTKARKKMNCPGKRTDQNGITDTYSIINRNSKHCYIRSHSAMLKSERSGEGRDMPGNVTFLSNPNASKINSSPKTKNRRPHSVDGNRLKTNISGFEARLKNPNSVTKSHFVPINVASDEFEQINASSDRTSRMDNVLSPLKPINENYEHTPVKCRRNIRSVSNPGIQRGMNPGDVYVSGAINVKEELKHLAWSNCNAAVESTKTTTGEDDCEESDSSNETLQAETSEDEPISNDGSSSRSNNAEIASETNTGSLAE